MPKLSGFFKNPIRTVAEIPESHVVRHPGKAVESAVSSAASTVSSVTKSVGHAVSGKTHHRGREVVELAPAFNDVRVQAVSGLEVPVVTVRMDELLKDCEYLKQVAEDINAQLDLKNTEIKALNRDAKIFNGTQEERLAHLESLIKDINTADKDNNADNVWLFMNHLVLAKRHSESV